MTTVRTTVPQLASKALSDGAQTITPAVFADTIARCRQVAAALGRRMEDD